MSNESKASTIKQLCQEVGFGCPVCRSPFLTWHHFDPPWHVEEHWRSEGIIAMCPLCHADADEKGNSPGAYSKEELRILKKTPRASEDVKGQFPSWQDKKRLLVRVGGCYTDTSAPIILVNDVPQITVGKNSLGLLSLTFELRNRWDNVVVKMEENWFTAYPRNVHDMKVTPKTKEVTVWLGKDDIGLQFSFHRLTMTELEDLLDRDRTIAEKRFAQEVAKWPAEHRAFLKQSESIAPWWIKNLPEELQRAYLAEDKIAYAVKQWVKNNCETDDDTIPLLDFDQMAIYFHGQRITIKDGVANFLRYCAAFGNTKGAINIDCRCANCSSAKNLAT